jgi:hypothetical protein
VTNSRSIDRSPPGPLGAGSGAKAQEQTQLNAAVPEPKVALGGYSAMW